MTDISEIGQNQAKGDAVPFKGELGTSKIGQAGTPDMGQAGSPVQTLPRSPLEARAYEAFYAMAKELPALSYGFDVFLLGYRAAVQDIEQEN